MNGSSDGARLCITGTGTAALDTPGVPGQRLCLFRLVRAPSFKHALRECLGSSLSIGKRDKRSYPERNEIKQ